MFSIVSRLICVKFASFVLRNLIEIKLEKKNNSLTWLLKHNRKHTQNAWLDDVNEFLILHCAQN